MECFSVLEMGKKRELWGITVFWSERKERFMGCLCLCLDRRYGKQRCMECFSVSEIVFVGILILMLPLFLSAGHKP